jgi:HAD superfamily hydrolase (TIGR01509 family)
MRPVRAVIFDMDGVIVDSEPCHESAFHEVIREIGYADKLQLRFTDYIGRTDQELWADFLAQHDAPHSFDDLMARKRLRMVEIIRREQPLFDGVLALVEKLAARYSLALASGSERPVVEEVLKLKSLNGFFSAVVTSSEVEHGKPAPDTFLRTAELINVPPQACCVIEDSKPGIVAGLAAGMEVIAIANTHPVEELRRATHVVQTYEEIERLLLRRQ